MHRFFSPSQDILDNKIIITDKNDIHHIKDVLRFKEKDEVIVFDEQGYDYRCFIEKISEKIILKIRDKCLPKQCKKAKITVACAIPKKSALDDIIDKLTQLGVDTIIPLISERVVVKLDEHKESLRLIRWQKIALSASKQCQRSEILTLGPVKNLTDVLSESGDFDLKLIPTCFAGKRKSLKDIINAAKPQNILVLIGPEGDFSPAEIDLAKRVGFIPVSLGDLVLRVETAAVAAVSFMRLNENH